MYLVTSGNSQSHAIWLSLEVAVDMLFYADFRKKKPAKWASSALAARPIRLTSEMTDDALGRALKARPHGMPVPLLLQAAPAVWGSVQGERANFTGLVLGCIESDLTWEIIHKARWFAGIGISTQ